VNLAFFLRGLLIGFSIAAPVGPISILCIRRTLTRGRLSGYVSGLGAATADSIYGSIAGFGLAFIYNFLVSQQVWLRLAGGTFLCYLGIRTFLAKPTGPAAPARESGLISDYASTFFLTLTNPMTIIAYVAVFAGLGLAGARNSYASAGVLVLGVFMGSFLWSFSLCSLVGFFREKFNQRGLGWVNRIAGIIITGFGVFTLLSLLR
jgi:threonine/homoserine/homoserine lactone efflux protein